MRLCPLSVVRFACPLSVVRCSLRVCRRSVKSLVQRITTPPLKGGQGGGEPRKTNYTSVNVFRPLRFRSLGLGKKAGTCPACAAGLKVTGRAGFTPLNPPLQRVGRRIARSADSSTIDRRTEPAPTGFAVAPTGFVVAGRSRLLQGYGSPDGAGSYRVCGRRTEPAPTGFVVAGRSRLLQGLRSPDGAGSYRVCGRRTEPAPTGFAVAGRSRLLQGLRSPDGAGSYRICRRELRLPTRVSRPASQISSNIVSLIISSTVECPL